MGIKIKADKFLQAEMKDHHQALTDTIIKKMEDAVKYEKPWFTCEKLPYNPVTGTRYKGINVISLVSRDFQDPRFLTFKNIQSLAAEMGEPIQIKKGEKGVPVFKANQKTFTNTNKDTGEETSFSMWTQVYAGTVFNASQLTGMPELKEDPKIEFSENDEAEKFVVAMQEIEGLKIEHGKSDRAYYSTSLDKIVLPAKESFKSVALYYRTLMHELGHSTGHEKRLNRKLTNSYGSPEYALEELVAELSSYFMGATIGMPYDPKTHENHAAYLKGYIETLKKDKGAIFKASGMASRAVEFQLNTKALYYGEVASENSANNSEEKEIPKMKM